MANSGSSNEEDMESSIVGATILYRDLPIISEYHMLIKEYVFEGRSGTCPFSEWKARMELIFASHRFPVEYQVPVAELLLRGSAERHWIAIRRDLGPNPSWTEFCTSVAPPFALTERLDEWNSVVQDFSLEMGETIIQFGQRFIEEVVDTYPLPPMSDLHKMQLYNQSIRRRFRFPLLAVPYGSFEELRAAHERINDFDILPYGATRHPFLPLPMPVNPQEFMPLFPATPVDPALAVDLAADLAPALEVLRLN